MKCLFKRPLWTLAVAVLSLTGMYIMYHHASPRPAETEDLKTEPTHCQPKSHVFFLKTHKTGSSTILNIMYRYGDRRNLIFALPVSSYQFSYPEYFSRNSVAGVKSGSIMEFHIMGNHMRFNAPEVKKLMPEDTFYFSILRDPVTLMESAFKYYKHIPAFSEFKSLKDFMDNGRERFNPSQINSQFARNSMTFDFGMRPSVPENKAELQQSAEVISMVERDFDLILIAEYFDESMILLKHALCWTLEDVVYFKLNSRGEETRDQLDPQTIEQVKEWNSLDWQLYQHFNGSFWQHVDNTLGRERLQREVKLLRDKRLKLGKVCLSEDGAVDAKNIKDEALKPYQSGNALIQGYNIKMGLDEATHQFCKNLITPELQYTDYLREKQLPKPAVKLNE